MPAQIEIVRGDITTLEVDAIVNAANSHLAHGGGVAAAIARAGGKTIQEESDQIGHVPVGGAVHTSGGRLPARWVIHAVGPRMGEGDEPAKLRSAVRSALELAEDLGARSVALPAISTGIFGYPLEDAATEILSEARKSAARLATVERVVICLYDENARQAFQKTLEELEQ